MSRKIFFVLLMFSEESRVWLEARFPWSSTHGSIIMFSEESSPALGYGWRLGFLGVLHIEVLLCLVRSLVLL